MNYSEALDYIHSTLKFGVKLGLQNMNMLLDLMGNPHRKLKYVHVGGTNGKGSTVAFVSSILIESGYKVGIYTSPFIERFTERIKINHEEINDQELVRITAFVKSKVDIMVSRGDNHPTEFEIVTAIAFQYFHEKCCDVVILEVGLGGRFDSTNVIDTPLVSVLTTISYDHMDILGDTLSKIAFEKAGIIKRNGEVVIYPQTKEVERVLDEACMEMGANHNKVDFSGLNIIEFGVYGQVFEYGGYGKLEISMLGDYQVRNAVVAIMTSEILIAKGFQITLNSLREGLKNTKWKGRFEIVSKSPLFIIDGAHNEEGAKSLSDNLQKYFPDKRKIFIVGVLKDKDYESMIKAVIPIASQFITVTPESKRAFLGEELAKIIEGYCANVLVSDTIEDAIRTSLETAMDTGVVCAFGSLYYIGCIRSYFLN